MIFLAITPQAAAVAALWFAPGKPPVVERVNVVGRYATVLTRGGREEGELVTWPILVEHFSFGWQAVDSILYRCDLESRRLGTSVDTALMRGMPKPKDDRPCRAQRRDAGPSADVERVRQLMRGPLVPSVIVSGDWAMGEWYGGGGGQSLYRKRDGRWQLVKSGGGAFGVDYMRKYGVPQSAWCPFHISDADCK